MGGACPTEPATNYTIMSGPNAHFFFYFPIKVGFIFYFIFTIAVALLHGDMDQNDRTKVIASFKKKDFPILVATDVAGEIGL